MAVLHYGTEQFEVPDDQVRGLLRGIGGKARSGAGGWATFSDVAGTEWSILVTDGLPIFIDAVTERGSQVIARRTG